MTRHRLTFTISGFEPDYSPHPGEMLRECLADWGLTQTELASRCGVSQKHISEIVNGKAGVGPDLALRLEEVTHISARLWVRLQADHDLHRAREASA